MHTMKQGISMTGLKQDSGITLRQLEGLTGLNRGRAHRAIVDPAAHRGDARRLSRAMKDRIRRNRSSDPELLAHVKDRAVPFLRGRQRRPIQLRRPLPDA